MATISFPNQHFLEDSLSSLKNDVLKRLVALHPYHIVPESPWPILISSAVLSILSSAALWFNGLYNSGNFFSLGILSVVIAGILWFKDVVTEGTFIGLHTRIVQQCLSLGVSLFIVTEAILFFSVFWAYFHSSLSPTVEIGTAWPPAGLIPLSPITVPLINTLLLISSGAAVTYGHHAIFKSARGPAIYGLILTVVLAIIFTSLQYIEYDQAGFSFSDGVFGSCFYFSTGLHGIHVLVGTLFLITGFARLVLYHFTKSHHLGLESAILYWHFVDVVWVFLYFAVYWWGSE